ncbi:MAG: hypothetical protein ABR574_11255 [Cryomorphaceae bacterium]
MNKKINFIIPLFIGLCLFSCGKDDDGSGGGEPPPEFRLSFYLADSLGNNLLPYDLPENPVVNPESFYAYSDRIDDIGIYFRSEDYGYGFRISEQFYYILNDFNWQQDSVFYFYSCFAMQCDTIKIYKPDFVNGTNDEPASCSAEWIIFQTDTLDLPYCRRLPIYIN